MLIQVCINVISLSKVYAPGIKPFPCNFSNKRCTSVADCCSCNKLKRKNSSISQKTISCLLRKLSAVNSKLRSNYFLYYISKDFANYLFVLDFFFFFFFFFFFKDGDFFVYLHEKHAKILDSNLERTRPNRQITEKRKTYIYTKKTTK